MATIAMASSETVDHPSINILDGCVEPREAFTHLCWRVFSHCSGTARPILPSYVVCDRKVNDMDSHGNSSECIMCRSSVTYWMNSGLSTDFVVIMLPAQTPVSVVSVTCCDGTCICSIGVRVHEPFCFGIHNCWIFYVSYAIVQRIVGHVQVLASKNATADFVSIHSEPAEQTPTGRQSIDVSMSGVEVRRLKLVFSAAPDRPFFCVYNVKIDQ